MKKQCLCLLLCVLLLLSSCQAPVETLPDLSASLPEPALPYEPPLGTVDMQYTGAWPLYYPSVDGQQLIAETTALSLEHGASAAVPALRALLSSGETDRHLRLGGQSRLYLSGRYAPEIAGGVCTVQLETSALSLTLDNLYTAVLAIAASLSGLDGIRYVNLLVNERAIGMDLTDNLPLGSLSSRTDVDLPTLLKQLETKRTPLGADASQTQLTSAATLYFPLQGEGGFLPEVRNITFPGQSVPQLAKGLIEALAEGSQYHAQAADLSSLLGFMTAAPEVSELAGGGRLLSLYFTSDLTSRLEILGLDSASVLGALVYTMTTFIPSLGAVRIFSGSTMITSVYGEDFGVMYFEEGMMRRRQYAAGLRDLTTVYLVRGGFLTPVTRAVPSSSAANPALLLSLLAEGASEQEERSGIHGIFSEPLDETDLIGISFDDTTLVLNLSAHCGSLLTFLPPEEQQCAAYALVLTYCEALGAKHLRFFFDSASPEDTSSGIFWGGDFMLNHALLEHSRG